MFLYFCSQNWATLQNWFNEYLSFTAFKVVCDKFFTKEQISLAKSTDYFIGIHGAGLALSIFMPKTSILHEIKNHAKNPLLTTMSSMSGHKTYSDILKSETNKINGNTYIFFDEEAFSKSVLDHMKKNNFFDWVFLDFFDILYNLYLF